MVLNIINIAKPARTSSANIGVYVILSIAAFLLGFIYFILLALARKGTIESHFSRTLLTQSLLYLYLAIQLTFCTLNIVTTGGVNSYIIGILIIGLFPISRPIQSLSTILFAFFYTFFVMYITRNVSSAWDLALLTDVWANLIIITGLVICISFFMYHMFVSNFMQRVNLQKANTELLFANKTLGSMNDRLEIVANTDQITGALNRRAMAIELENKWRMAYNSQNYFAVAIVDIDFFKGYNDQYGHLEGDKCLRLVANSLRNSFRHTGDIVCRFGGEEFLTLFNASPNDALEIVEQARISLEQLQIPHEGSSVSPYVTISAGLCVAIPSDTMSSENMLRLADTALYHSKNSGRNRTTLKTAADA